MAIWQQAEQGLLYFVGEHELMLDDELRVSTLNCVATSSRPQYSVLHLVITYRKRQGEI